MRATITPRNVLLLLGSLLIIYSFYHLRRPESGTGSVRSPLLLPSLSNPKNSLTHLILVPCHAVWMGSGDGTRSSDWFLKNFQLGDQLAFMQHISIASHLAAEDPESLLVFSGTQTVADYLISESQSYWNLWSKSRHYSAELGARTTTEEFARDSYENLLFSIARFKEVTSRYPQKVTVVGFDFKQRRFTELHRTAIGFPRQKFEYIGTTPTPEGIDLSDGNSKEAKRYLQDLSAKELNNAVKLYEKDPHGCLVGEGGLMSKKWSRNQNRRAAGYSLTCPEMRELLEVCSGSRKLSHSRVVGLPWYDGSSE